MVKNRKVAIGIAVILSTMGATGAVGATEEEALPEQPPDAAASMPQLEALLVQSLCGQESIQSLWNVDALGCARTLYEERAVERCTTANQEQVPLASNQETQGRLTMAQFSTRYAQCLVAQHGQTG